MHADRTNRGVLLLLGLLLLAAGVASLLAASSAFGSATATRALTDNTVSRYVGGNATWVWIVAAVIALVVLALSVRWLIAILFSTDRVRALPLRTSGSLDPVTLAAPALGDAVRNEIESYRGVRSARVWLVGRAQEPHLAITVDTDRDADLAALRDRIESGAVAHARQALDQPGLPVRLDLEVKRRTGARVA